MRYTRIILIIYNNNGLTLHTNNFLLKSIRDIFRIIQIVYNFQYSEIPVWTCVFNNPAGLCSILQWNVLKSL